MTELAFLISCYRFISLSFNKTKMRRGHRRTQSATIAVETKESPMESRTDNNEHEVFSLLKLSNNRVV